MSRVLRVVLFVVLMCVTGVGKGSKRPVDAEPCLYDSLTRGRLRILAIGNSFSQDAVEQYLCELFAAAGFEAVIGNMYIGGCSLEEHWSNAGSGAAAYSYRKVVKGVKSERQGVDLATALADEDWDIITLQQVSDKSGVYASYDPWLGNMIEWVSARSGAEIWFHQTWAYAADSDHKAFPTYDCDQTKMYEAIVSAVIGAMEEHPQIAGVIPSGTAVQNGRASYLGDTFTRDGYHLQTTYGRYTVACTWFEALSGESAEDNGYAPASVDGRMKAAARSAAHRAVENPFEVSDMADFNE